MEPLEDEINAITQRVGMPDRADQGWISLVGAEVSEISWRLFSLAGGPLSPGSGNCRIKAGTMVIPGCTIDLYAGQGVPDFMGNCRSDLGDSCETVHLFHLFADIFQFREIV